MSTNTTEEHPFRPDICDPPKRLLDVARELRKKAILKEEQDEQLIETTAFDVVQKIIQGAAMQGYSGCFVSEEELLERHIDEKRMEALRARIADKLRTQGLIVDNRGENISIDWPEDVVGVKSGRPKAFWWIFSTLIFGACLTICYWLVATH